MMICKDKLRQIRQLKKEEKRKEIKRRKNVFLSNNREGKNEK